MPLSVSPLPSLVVPAQAIVHHHLCSLFPVGGTRGNVSVLCNTVLAIRVLQELFEAGPEFALIRHPQKSRKRSVWRIVQMLC